MTDIYQLNPYQFDSMMRMANKEDQMLLCLEPKEGDDEATMARLWEQLEKADDLVALGLIEDKSNSAAEAIFMMKTKAGRGLRVFIPTLVGFDMFNGSNKVIN